jgi:HSP20 family protein
MNCNTEAKSAETAERTQRQVFQPRIDLWETATDWNLVAELPGVRPEDLDIVTKEGTLTVEGKVRDRAVEDAKVRRSEYGVGDFRRTFHLGESLATDAAEATLKDGVLTLRLPKHESVLPKKIQVRQG